MATVEPAVDNSFNAQETRRSYLSDLTLWDNSMLEAVVIAKQLSMKSCLLSSGFEYEIGEFQPVASPTARQLYPDESIILEYGYAFRARGLSKLTESESRPYSADETAAIEACRSTVDDRLGYDQLYELNAIVLNAGNDIEAQIAADSAVADAAAQWSNCMASEGYVFPTTDDAEAAAANGAGGQSAPGAVRQAVVDYQCRRKARLEETKSTVRNALNDLWIESNPEVLTSLEAARRQIHDRATSGE